MLHWQAELSKSLIHLSAHGWGWVPSLLVVWPEVTQHWSLPALWWGQCQALGGLTPRSTSQNFCYQCPCPLSEPQPPPASAGDPPTLAGRSVSVFYGVIAPSPGPDEHTTLCVPSKSESLFPPVLSKSCNQTC